MARERELKKVSDLLERYKNNLVPPQKTIEKAFIKAAAEACGITLLPSSVRYTVSTKTLYLTPPSVIKQELLIQKEVLVKALEKALGDRGATITIL